MIAQQLYEGINVGGEHMGLITYMRTDSTRLSLTFINRAMAFISETYGNEYLGHAKQIKRSWYLRTLMKPFVLPQITELQNQLNNI